MLLDCPSVGALTYEQSSAGVTQIVEPQLTRQARCCHGLLELTPIEVVVQHPDPTRARKDELGPAPSTAGQVLRQHRAEKPWKHHRARLPVLRRTDHRVACLDDINAPCVEVKSPDPERRNLPSSQPGIGGEVDQGSVHGPDCVGESRYPPWSEELHLGVLRLRQLDPPGSALEMAGVLRNSPIVHCQIKDHPEDGEGVANRPGRKALSRQLVDEGSRIGGLNRPDGALSEAWPKVFAKDPRIAR
jgi:hypothetical protein